MLFVDLVMNNAVALIQSYLQLNGYFTVAEYPVTQVINKITGKSQLDICQVSNFTLSIKGKNCYEIN
jgi:hypothetical protein